MQAFHDYSRHAYMFVPRGPWWSIRPPIYILGKLRNFMGMFGRVYTLVYPGTQPGYAGHTRGYTRVLAPTPTRDSIVSSAVDGRVTPACHIALNAADGIFTPSYGGP